jgi:serine protease Do
VRPAFLGVKVQQLTEDMAEALGMPAPRGSIVAWVTEHGPADAAGLQIGDIIMRFDDEVPTDERDLLRKIASSTPGRQVKLDVLRNGQHVDVPVTLGEWPRMAWEERDAPTMVSPPHWNVPPDLGLQVAALTEKIAAENEIPPHPAATKAVLVEGVAQDADVAQRGVSVGDLILRLDRSDIGSYDDWMRALAAARADKKKYAMLLLMPKEASEGDPKLRAPKWIAVRITPD